MFCSLIFASFQAVTAPTCAEIQQVLQAAGLEANLEPNKMYSRNQDREPESQGRVRVQLKEDDGKPKYKDFPTSTFLLLCPI